MKDHNCRGVRPNGRTYLLVAIHTYIITESYIYIIYHGLGEIILIFINNTYIVSDFMQWTYFDR